MSNVFDTRARAPQFPQRRALKTRKISPFRKGGKVPGYFLGGLFGSSPGTSSTSSQSQTNTSVTDPNYNSLMDYVLSQGLNLAQNTPFKPYVGPNGETNPIVGLTPNQQQGITGAATNVGNYQPFFNAASGQLSTTGGAYDPTKGQSFVDQAGNMQTGSGAASPFLSAGTQTFPSQMAAYMSPYTSNVVQGIQDASNRNFEQNTLRSINDTFSGGNAAQFGREQHGNAVGNAVFAKTQADDAAVANALESGYSTAGNLFNADQNRQLSAGQTAGSLANAGIQTQAGLGQTAAGIQGTNTSAGLGLAQGQTGLGAATQQGGITDVNALEQTGSVGQNTAQNQSNFNYNQFQQQQQYPWQVLQAAQGLGQGWQLPTQSNTQSSSTSSVAQGSGSPFGQGLGGLLGVGSLATPGASGTSALGNIFSGIQGWFSEGGYTSPKNKARRKSVPGYANGGVAPWMSDVGGVLGSIIGSIYGGPIGGMAGNQGGKTGGAALSEILGGDWGAAGNDVLSDLLAPLKQLGGGGLPGMPFGGGGGGGLPGLPFAQGGMVPTIAGMRRRNQPMHMRGMVPTGMPQMPQTAPPPMPTAVVPNGRIPARNRTVPYAKGGFVGDTSSDDIFDSPFDSQVPRPRQIAPAPLMLPAPLPTVVQVPVADQSSAKDSSSSMSSGLSGLANILKGLGSKSESAGSPSIDSEIANWSSYGASPSIDSEIANWSSYGSGAAGDAASAASSGAGSGLGSFFDWLPSLSSWFADGGQVSYEDSPFLKASEGLDQRLYDEDPATEMIRRGPPGPLPEYYRALADRPTGRDAVLASDPLLYLWRHLPSHVQDALSFGRDMMPDRAIAGYVDSSRDMARSLMNESPLDALGSGEDALMSMMGVFAPGYGRAAERAFSPFVRHLLGAR